MCQASYGEVWADRIKTAVQGATTTYTVNANGNTTARGSDTFAYDQANRLTGATVGGVASSYTFDGDGKRASQTVAGATTRSVYDAVGGLPTLLDDGARKYVWGLGLAYAVGGTGIEVYHADGLGSVQALTDAAGRVTQTQRTDEYGVPTETTGASGQPFGFTGEQRDATGLVYLRARMYDPASGRFMQRDTHPGGTGDPGSQHRYAYVANNPVNATDPSGHDPLKLNKALRQRGYSDHCFVGDREGSGTHISIGCMNMQLLALLRFVLQTPFGPRIASGASLASPDGGGGSSGSGDLPRRGTPAYSRLVKLIIRIRNIRGMGTVDGSVSRAEADFVGRRWVGDGYTVNSDGSLTSKDGLRQYRPASPKPNSPFTKTGVQANYESRDGPMGRWTNNAHLDIND
jgi:RHS repeat-associated protein